MLTIDDLLREARKYAHTLNEKRVREAYQLAEQAHAGQTRMSGEPYITHPLAVAMLLTQYKADENSLIAALLHDVVEDTKYGKKEIEKRFGKMVSKMVEALTKLPSTGPQDGAGKGNGDENGNGNGNGLALYDFDSKVESIRKIFEVMQQDVRVLVIKLCDRLHNMTTLKHFRREKQQRIAQETLDIYVKIADRLSIYELKEQLETLSFQYLHPEEYTELQEERNRTHDRFLRRQHKIEQRLKGHPLLKKAEDVIIRQANSYPDILKSEPANLRLQAFVIMKKEDDCYLALKGIHELWKYKRNEVRDYISLPKSNGYQALHTTVVRHDGSMVTFIIQTASMYEYGRYGVIRESFRPDAEGKKIHLPWIEHLKKIHQKTKEKSGDYITALQNDILKGAIIIYTEDNKTLFLPPLSTALDAAFYYTGKKAQFVNEIQINGKSQSFATYIKDGDNLTFSFATKTQLSPDWFDTINTSYSKSTICELVGKMSHKKQLLYGQTLLQKEMHRRGFGYIEEIDDTLMKRLLKEYKVSSLNEVYTLIATGKLSARKASQLLLRGEMKGNKKDQLEYQMSMELVPHKFGSLSPFFDLFSDSNYQLKEFRITSDSDEGMKIKASIFIMRNSYDTFVKAIRGLYDVRTFELKETRRSILGKWLLAAFMLLVALDPIVAYYLIQEQGMHYYDLLSVRFFTIFATISLVLFFRKIASNYVKESPIHYAQRDFVLSVISFFLTAFFTYLSFAENITPFAYQLSIYIVLFPFFSVYQEKYSKRATLFFQTACAILYVMYLYSVQESGAFDPKLIIYAIAAAFTFTAYTHFSTQFQNKEHIERRSLSFFKTVSLYGALFSLVPYLFLQEVVVPPVHHILPAILFSVVFITIPYIIYYIISGIYSFTSSVWKKFVTIVLMVKIGEVALLGLPVNPSDFVIAIALISAYWIFSRTLLSPRTKNETSS